MLLSKEDFNQKEISTHDLEAKTSVVNHVNHNSSLEKDDNLEFNNLRSLNSTANAEKNNSANNGLKKIKKAGVVLPNPDDLYLKKYLTQPNLRVGKAYLAQALSFFEAGNCLKAIAACRKALEIHPDLPEAHKIWGNCLQQKGMVAEAFGQYAKALELDPDLAEVYSNMGSLFAKEQKWNQAINYFQQALNINPRMASIHRNLARIWEKLNNKDRAEEHLFEAIYLEPNTLTAEQYTHLAKQFYLKGKQQRAITCYCYAVKLKPNFQPAYIKLIDILEANNRWQEAGQYYRKLLALKEKDNIPKAAPEPNNQINLLLAPATQKNVQDKSNTKVKNISSAGQSSSKLLQLPPASSKNQRKGKKVIELNVTKDKEKSLADQQQADSIKIKLQLGNLYTEKKQWRQAIDFYRQVIKLEPNSTLAYRQLAKIYRKLGKQELFADMLYEVFRLKPQSASAQKHFVLGNLLLTQNKLVKAIACYQKAVDLRPEFIEAHQKLIQLRDTHQQQLKNKRPQAIVPTSLASEDVVESSLPTSTGKVKKTPINLNLKPTPQQDAVNQDSINKSANYLELGKTAELEQDWKLATVCYRKAIEIYAKNWEAFYQLGNVLAQQKFHSNAIKAYRKAIALNSNHASSYHNLGEALVELNQWQDAERAFTLAIKLNPNFSWSHYKLGLVLIKLKQKERAAKELRLSIQFNPGFDWAYHQLGDVLVDLEYLDDAVNAYRQALKITPNLPKTDEKLNEVLRRRAERDRLQVEHFYQKAIEQHPDREALYYKRLEINSADPEAYIGLAQLKEDKGDYDTAIAFYKIALQIQPNNSQIITALEKLKAQFD